MSVGKAAGLAHSHRDPSRTLDPSAVADDQTQHRG